MITEIVKCEACGEADVKVIYRAEDGFPSWYILCEECLKKEQPRHTFQDQAEEWCRKREQNET